MWKYRQDPEPRIYHEDDFCKKFLGECQDDPDTLYYSFALHGFVLKGGNVVVVNLPVGWAATEVKIAYSVLYEGAYENEWGYATYVGPRELICDLATYAHELEVAERQVQGMVEAYWDTPKRPEPQIEDSSFVGSVQLSTRH